VPVAFGLYLRRGAPHRRVVAAFAVALLLFSVRVPLAGYAAAHGKDDSPVLAGVLRFEQVTNTGDGSLIVALVAGALSLVALGLAWRPRRAALVGLALTVAASSALSAGAYGFDHRNSVLLRKQLLPADPRWVDHSGLKNVGMLLLPNSTSERAFEQLIWNRSITDLLLLGPEKIDAYRQTDIGVSDDGRILVPGGTFVGPLLVQTYGSRATLTGAVKVATGPDYDLWRPAGVPRLALLAGGWYHDGWLAWRSFVSVWPDSSGRVAGTLRLTVGMPVGTEVTPLTLRAPGYRRTVVLRPGVRRVITIPVSARGPWTVRLSTPTAGYVGLRPVSVRALSPVFVRDGGTILTCSVPTAPLI